MVYKSQHGRLETRGDQNTVYDIGNECQNGMRGTPYDIMVELNVRGEAIIQNGTRYDIVLAGMVV